MPTFDGTIDQRNAMVKPVSVDHIKFAPDILIRLGEELIPNPEQGVIELVKNSYDADATYCNVEFKNATEMGGILRIEDNGYGMDLDDIKNGWLILGASLKYQTRNKRTPMGRLRVGDKGLGRLAALRLGMKVTLTTRPSSEPGSEYRMAIDWSAYSGARLVEDIDLTITKTKTNRRPGTEILISALRVQFGIKEIERLARELLLLTDPFGDVLGFSPKLIGTDFPQLEAKVINVRAYLKEANYHMEASLDDKGLATARVLDWKGRQLYQASHSDLTRTKEPYDTVSAKLDVWFFLLGSADFSTRKIKKDELGKWLTETGGIHFYHRGLRVRPYGDPGHDWLDLNLARVRNPEERPSTNNTIGRVVVEDFFNELQQKTDRLGFIETSEFGELKKFCVDTFEWVAKERLKAAEARRIKRRDKAISAVRRSTANLDQFIDHVVQKPARADLRKYIKHLQTAAQKKSKILQEELQLYRSLATAGTTSAVFAHESDKPVKRMSQLVDSLYQRTRAIMGDRFVRIEKIVESLRRDAFAVRSFTQIPIFLLRRDKRREGMVEVHNVIDDVVQVFDPFFKDYKIDVILQKADTSPKILGSVSMLEAIVTNFLTNTIHAFDVETETAQNRKVVIRTVISDSGVVLSVLDNGPGIKMPIDEVWLPGRTTTANGTGFGLTIVRDVVADLDGEVFAVAKGELGGAEFAVRIPLINGGAK